MGQRLGNLGNRPEVKATLEWKISSNVNTLECHSQKNIYNNKGHWNEILWCNTSRPPFNKLNLTII